MPVRIPRRRWLGRTVTAETAAAGSVAPPGTVRCVPQERKVPQARSPSNATQVRAGSQVSATDSATARRSGRSRNAVLMTSTAAPNSSGAAFRISIPMAANLAPRRATLDWRPPTVDEESPRVTDRTPEGTVLPEGTRLLHIGPPWTGTASLQAALFEARPALLEQGVRHIGRTRNPAGAVRAVTGGPGSASGAAPPSLRRWTDLVGEFRGAREPRVVSRQRLLRLGEPDVDRADRPGLGRDRIHVVVTLSPLGRVLPAVAAGRPGRDAPRLRGMAAARCSTRAGQGSHAFWWLHRHDELIERWAAVLGGDRVTAVVVDELDHDDAPARLRGPARAARGHAGGGRDLSNRSLTLPEVEAVRAFNLAAKEASPDPAVQAKIMRYGAAIHMKTRVPGPDEARIDTPQWALDRAGEIAAAMVPAIAASGVRVVGDLAALPSLSPAARPAMPLRRTGPGAPRASRPRWPSASSSRAAWPDGWHPRGRRPHLGGARRGRARIHVAARGGRRAARQGSVMRSSAGRDGAGRTPSTSCRADRPAASAPPSAGRGRARSRGRRSRPRRARPGRPCGMPQPVSFTSSHSAGSWPVATGSGRRRFRRDILVFDASRPPVPGRTRRALSRPGAPRAAPGSPPPPPPRRWSPCRSRGRRRAGAS